MYLKVSFLLFIKKGTILSLSSYFNESDYKISLALATVGIVLDLPQQIV